MHTMQTKQTLTNKTPPCQPRQHICAVQETQALLSMPGMRDENFAGSVVVRHPRWADRRALTKWERLGRPAPALALPPGPVGSGHV